MPPPPRGEGSFVKPWVKELSCVALVAATCAIALPRALMPRAAAAHRAPQRRARATAATPVTARAPAPAAVAPPAAAPLDDEPAGAPHDVAQGRASRHGAGAATPSLPRGVTYANRRWVADLRVLPPVRSALAGASVAPPGEGDAREGYQVLSTDHMGLLRAAGVRPGDVLVGVNGMPLRNPDDALDALSQLRGASRATFEFQRGAARYHVPVELVGRDVGQALRL